MEVASAREYDFEVDMENGHFLVILELINLVIFKLVKCLVPYLNVVTFFSIASDNIER